MNKLLQRIILTICVFVILLSFNSCLNGNDNLDTQSTFDTVISEKNSNVSIEPAVTEAVNIPDKVPDSLVLRDITIPENTTYEILHNYDEATHIDDVEVVTYYNGSYGTEIKRYTYSYQYDKSSDLWTLFGSGHGLKSDTVTFNEQAFLANARFTGVFTRYESGSYDIVIQDMDFENKKITVNYWLYFDKDSMVVKGTETLDIYNASTGEQYIAINYQRSMVVRFEQLFILDLDKGLYAPK